MSKQHIENLREMIEIQCTEGNWNYDSYMHGMANGMIYALSLFTDETPEFKEVPDEWLCDKPSNTEPLEA